MTTMPLSAAGLPRIVAARLKQRTGSAGAGVAPLARLEADHLDEAIELAARFPPARLGGAIEVRPLVPR
jgi:hypothetical protein